MADEREEIRSRISILDLVGQRVALKKAGKHWKGLCPFHDDRNPSFTVSEHTGYYRCWSCGESGDIFNWVMKTQNMEFREALEYLAQKAGVTLSRKKPGVEKSVIETRSRMMEAARGFFVKQLQISPIARQYCEARGLASEVLIEWEIGYAPDLDSALCTHLQKSDFHLPEAKTLFLVDADSQGGYYDKFRGRLMFPIRDEKGEIVGFGGRALGDGLPKYINSGDTPLFRKSRVLYGLHKAKDAITSAKRAVLVEGYLDVIACHRAGIKEAVAPLGTSLTEEHAKLLKRWCEEVVILFDGDEAGQKAAERALDVLGAAGIRCRVALSPTGDDPDSLLKRSGPAAVQDLPGAAVEPLTFRIAQLEAALPPDSEAFWNQAVEILARANSLRQVEKAVLGLVHKHLSGHNPSAASAQLLDRIRRARSNTKISPSRVSAKAVVMLSSDMTHAESAFFAAILDESVRSQAWPYLDDSTLFGSPTAKELAIYLQSIFGSKEPGGPPHEWLHRIEDEDQRARLASTESPLLKMNRDVLNDVIEKLQKSRGDRDIEKLKALPPNERDLAEIQERLRALKAQ